MCKQKGKYRDEFNIQNLLFAKFSNMGFEILNALIYGKT